MFVQPYLQFEGRAEEAIAFYTKAIGAKTQMLMRFKESPEPMPPGMLPPGAENKVMHGAFHVGDSLIMASDGNCSGKANFGGFSLTITAKDDAEAKKLFAALGEGGQVNMPLTKTFFASSFGSLVDRFGVNWMVIVPMPM